MSERALFSKLLENLISRSTAKNNCPVSLLSVVSEVCWSSRKMWPFCDFSYGFSSSWSIADLQTVAFDRTASVFNRFDVTQLPWYIQDRLLTELCMLSFFTNLKFMYLALFVLFSAIDSFGWSGFDNWCTPHTCVCLLWLVYVWYWTCLRWHLRSLFPYGFLKFSKCFWFL